MSAALRLADARVFHRLNAALPELLETGKARGITAHDLRHVALVLRVLELEIQTKSELTTTNLLNLIISDRFLDVPPTYDSQVVAHAHAHKSASDSQTRCDASNPLCVYAESVSVTWAMAKIKQAYRSRQLLRYLQSVVHMNALPQLSPKPFHGLPLFASRDVKPAQKLRVAMQDYLVMYRESMLAAYQQRPPDRDDPWGRAAFAVLLADRAGFTVGHVLSELRLRSLADVEDSPRLDAFIQTARALPAQAQAEDDAKTELLRTPDRVTHVGIYSLASPSSENAPFANAGPGAGPR